METIALNKMIYAIFAKNTMIILLKRFIGILFIFVFLTRGITGQDDPVLLEIGSQPVKLSEFIYIYEKNHGEDANYSRESVEEYLQLFVNFKLKVKKARELQLDTLPELIEELSGYRKQLAGSYLMEKELSERLLAEMYERRNQDVRISHMLFKVRRNAPESEWQEAHSKAGLAMNKLHEGEAFEKVALEMSEDENTAPFGGDLGYITAWLPSGFYYLENAAYNLSIGEISKPIQTRLGVHIVKVIDKRPAYGKIEVAHILIREKEGDAAAAKERINRISQLAKNNADFFELAKTLSDDRVTSSNGGRLQAFGINTFDNTFEEAAFALKNDGDVSEPVKTKAGWHLIKRISKPEESYDEFKRRMKPQLPTLERFTNIKDILIEEIKEETGYTWNEIVLDSFASTLNESFYSYRWEKELSSNPTLLSFGSEYPYTLDHFVDFARKNARLRMRHNKEKSPKEALYTLFDEYVRILAMDYEERNLENKYPDFKSLMREYEEGILLFEISKNTVWDKASTDTAGLRKYYNAHKENYYYTPEAKLAIISIPKNKTGLAEEVYAYASKNSINKTLSKYNKKETVLDITFEDINAEDSRVKNMEWKNSSVSQLMNDDEVGNITFYKLETIYPKKFKSLEESRGYVMAHYQQSLEEKWVKELKSNYPVTIYKDVIEMVIKS